jgi:cytochrome P450
MTEVLDRRSLREPTGPRLGLVHLLRLRREPVQHSAWLREHYGEVYRMHVFGTEMYVVSGPEAFEQVFVNRDKVFASGPAWSHFIGPFFTRGLMLLDFEEHLHHRRIMQAAFGADALRRYHAMMRPHLVRRLAAWEDVAQPRLQRMFKDLTLDLALEVFVGVELTDAERARINAAFIDAVRAGTAIVRRPLPGGVGPWSRGLAARRVLEDFFRAALPDKRRRGGDDLFAQLCSARDDEGHEFSDTDVVNHMIFLLMAAHDTTTTTMTSMAYQLARAQDWQERCRAEARALPDPTYDEALGLTALDLVMKESLRLCAPVPSIPRTATRETAIGGYRIPAGAIVTNSPYSHHFLPDVWRDAARFDPERFTPERAEDKVHRTAFVPFGAGVHKCIGMHFAGLQVRAIFHELLSRYRWSVPAGYEMPIDLVALPVARDGLPVTLEPLHGPAGR